MIFSERNYIYFKNRRRWLFYIVIIKEGRQNFFDPFIDDTELTERLKNNYHVRNQYWTISLYFLQTDTVFIQ